MTAPSLAERRQPGLSVTLTGPRSPVQCQSCGIASTDAAFLLRWQECDEWDQKTHTIVVLCKRCSDRHIEPSHRLYHLLDLNEPCAGAMRICVGCAFNSGTRCLHEQAKQNGGPGLAMTFPPPTRMHRYCSGRNARSGWVTIFPGPVTACPGRTEVDAEYA